MIVGMLPGNVAVHPDVVTILIERISSLTTDTLLQRGSAQCGRPLHRQVRFARAACETHTIASLRRFFAPS